MLAGAEEPLLKVCWPHAHAQEHGQLGVANRFQAHKRTLRKWCTIVSSGSGAKLTRRRSLRAAFFFCCLRAGEPSAPPSAPRFLACTQGRGKRWRPGCVGRRQAVQAAAARAGECEAVALLPHRAQGPVLLGRRRHGGPPLLPAAASCRCLATACHCRGGSMRACGCPDGLLGGCGAVSNQARAAAGAAVAVLGGRMEMLCAARSLQPAFPTFVT